MNASVMNAKGMSLDDFICRKLQPVKVTINLLTRELELADTDTITVTKHDLDAVISTLEIFVEEYERVSAARPKRLTQKKADFLPGAKVKAMA